MPQSILHPTVEYGRVVPKKRLVRPGQQEKRELEKRRQEPMTRKIDGATATEPAPPNFGRRNVTSFMERDTGVMDVMYPARHSVGANQSFGIEGNILRPPVGDVTHIDPKAALRLKWSETEARPADKAPPVPPLQPNLDIFGKPVPTKQAPRPLTPTVCNPITLQPDPYFRPPNPQLAPQAAGTPWKYDVFGNPKPSELRPGTEAFLAAKQALQSPRSGAQPSRPTSAAPSNAATQREAAVPVAAAPAHAELLPAAGAVRRPVATVDQIGQHSIHEHYAKVMKAANRDLAALAQSTASRHVDPTATPVAAEVPNPAAKLDIFGNPIRHAANESFARRKPWDGGGEGVQIGDARETVKVQRSAVPPQFSQPTVVRIVPDEVPQASQATAVSRIPDNTAARREAQQKAAAEVTSTDPGSVLRTSAFYRELLRVSKGWGIRPIRLELRSRDTDEDGIITVVDARRGFGAVGVTITDSDAEIIRRAGLMPDLPAGRIFLPKLMESLRGPLPPPQREAAIRAAFLAVARGAPSIPIVDLCARLEPRGHIAYEPNDRASPRVIQQSFGKLWGPDFATTPTVTEEHFVGYFRDVSVAITSDADFRKMMGAMFPLKA